MRSPIAHKKLFAAAVVLATVVSSNVNAQSGAAVDTTRFVVLFSDRLAGHLKVWQEGQDNVSDYEYNDRGRGPHIRERMTLDPSSYITRATISGHNYLKDSVDERFTYDNGTASWKNHVEGEGLLQIRLLHRRAAVLDDDGFATELPDVRERLHEDLDALDLVVHI